MPHALRQFRINDRFGYQGLSTQSACTHRPQLVVRQHFNHQLRVQSNGRVQHSSLTSTTLASSSSSHGSSQQWASSLSYRGGEALCGLFGTASSLVQNTAVSAFSQHSAGAQSKSPQGNASTSSNSVRWALRGSVHARAKGSPDNVSKQTTLGSSKVTRTNSPDVVYLQSQIDELRSALETATLDKLHAEARAREAELRAQEAQEALVKAQEAASSLNRQYSQLSGQLDARRGSSVSESSNGSSNNNNIPELARQVNDLQAQLEDLDYRLGWALRDLRAHQLVLRAQGELNMHLSGLPSNMQQQIFEQVDRGAELLGDGGSATVHAITLNGEPLAVKVMPLYDINTARPYHFRDICTTFLRHQRSPYIEMPLHTFLRLKDDEVEGTQYYLYTVWPRRHMDVDQLLCRRSLRPSEIVTIMLHTVLALQDLAVARMVHADVKPPNVLVMLGPDGLVDSAHLTDFGSVQFVPPGEESAPAIWDGQLAWNWPPEQRTAVHLQACDAWGLAFLYSCMKVINPSRPEVTDTLQDDSVAEAEFDRVRDTELLPDVPEDAPELRAITHLMRRCIVRNPHARPSIREIANALHSIKEQAAARAAAASTSSSSASGNGSNGATRGMPAIAPGAVAAAKAATQR